MVCLIIQFLVPVLFQDAAHIQNRDSLLLQLFSEGVKIPSLICCRCEGRQLVREDFHCIRHYHGVLLHFPISLSEVSHGDAGLLQVFPVGFCELLYQVSVFSQIDAV